MKGSSGNMIWVIGGVMVAILIFTVLIRSLDFANTPEATAFRIANTIAVHVNELSAAEEGLARIEMEDEHAIGFGDNRNGWVWLKQIALPEFAEKLLLDKITRQKPQGVYVVVQPPDEKRQPQHAYVAAYSLSTQDIKGLGLKEELGKGTAVCVEKKEGQKLAEVRLC